MSKCIITIVAIVVFHETHPGGLLRQIDTLSDDSSSQSEAIASLASAIHKL